jgi:hypothetical protein
LIVQGVNKANHPTQIPSIVTNTHASTLPMTIPTLEVFDVDEYIPPDSRVLLNPSENDGTHRTQSFRKSEGLKIFHHLGYMLK